MIGLDVMSREKWRAVIDPDTAETNRPSFFIELCNGHPGHGTPVVWSDNCGCAGRSVRTDAETARLIAAAPEMLKLLREMEWSDHDGVDYCCPVCGAPNVPPPAEHAPDCALGALFARIDAKPTTGEP